uniref:Uncharacterized protein n=1 Tax=Cacopsylla melanoneura TaxID=428564 RepID=A0A8D8RUT5_9HEMI
MVSMKLTKNDFPKCPIANPLFPLFQASTQFNPQYLGHQQMSPETEDLFSSNVEVVYVSAGNMSTQTAPETSNLLREEEQQQQHLLILCGAVESASQFLIHPGETLKSPCT